MSATTHIERSDLDERFSLHPDYEMYETVPGQIVVVNTVTRTETVLPDDLAAIVFERWNA